MLELAGPLAVAALVLTVGGLFKLRDPGPTRQMYASIGFSSGRVVSVLAIVSGLVEVALGSATFLVGGRVLTALVAASFTIFAVLAWRLMRVSSAGSCGCFGRHSGQITWLHVAVDLGVAATAITAAAVDAPGFLDARAELPAGGVPFLGLAALGAWFVVAALTVLPNALVAARRMPRATSVSAFQITSTP